MYFVHYREGFHLKLNSFEAIEEAQKYIRDLASKGIRDFHLSQEIPVKVKVEVEV